MTDREPIPGDCVDAGEERIRQALNAAVERHLADRPALGYSWPPPLIGSADELAELARHRASADLRPEAEAEWADEWDSADSDAYQARVEAGLEPEAEL